MNRKRGRLEIIHAILSAIKENGKYAKPTHILYKSNLSHKMFMEYLAELLKSNFIEEVMEGGKRKYSLTVKGYKYLEDYGKIRSFLESYGLE